MKTKAETKRPRSLDYQGLQQLEFEYQHAERRLSF
jgi:hypothetical protein